jgi:hypothetical protein
MIDNGLFKFKLDTAYYHFKKSIFILFTDVTSIHYLYIKSRTHASPHVYTLISSIQSHIYDGTSPFLFFHRRLICIQTYLRIYYIDRIEKDDDVDDDDEKKIPFRLPPLYLFFSSLFL